MSASQSGVYNTQEFSDLGVPLIGGRVYTYVQGTTTHKSAYTDHAAATPHTYTSDGIGGQYIALNSRGELPAPLYLTAGSYDIALKTAAGATVWTRRADPVLDLANDLTGSGGSSLVGFIQSGTGAVATTAQAKLRESVSVFDFMTAAQIADVQAGTLTLDVTAAVVAGIAAVSGTYGSTPGGRRLYFPMGAYSISSLDFLIGNQNVTLVGDGSNYSSNVNRGTRLVARNATNPYLIKIYRTTNIRLEGMSLDLNNLKTVGIELSHAGGTGSINDYCSYTDLEFLNVATAGAFVSCLGNASFLGGEVAVHKFNNCVFQLNGSGGSYIGRSVHISNYNAWDWTFNNCYFAGGSQTASMWLEAGAVTLRSCVFENNDTSSYDILMTATAWLRSYDCESHSQQPHLYIQALVHEGNLWSRSTTTVQGLLHFSNTATPPTVTIVDDSDSPLRLASIKGYGVQINYQGTYSGFTSKVLDITNVNQVAIGVGATRYDIASFKSQPTTAGYIEKLYDKTLTFNKTQQYDATTNSFITVGPQTVGGVQTVAGANLVSNGTFDTVTTGWTANGTGGAIAIVAGGFSGNCLQVTGTSYGYANQIIATGVGRKYRITAYYKNGTSTGILRVSSTAGGAGDVLDKAVTNAAWTQASYVFTAVGTSSYVNLFSGASGTMLWDSVTVTELPIVAVPDFCVTGLPVYATNAAALAGGLAVGLFYRTGADPDPVCVVH